MNFFDWVVTAHPLYRALRHECEALREQQALITSAHGADYRPGANCDSDIMRRFVDLERDFQSLEKDLQNARIENLSIRQALRDLLQALE